MIRLELCGFGRIPQRQSALLITSYRDMWYPYGDINFHYLDKAVLAKSLHWKCTVCPFLYSVLWMWVTKSSPSSLEVEMKAKKWEMELNTTSSGWEYLEFFSMEDLLSLHPCMYIFKIYFLVESKLQLSPISPQPLYIYLYEDGFLYIDLIVWVILQVCVTYFVAVLFQLLETQVDSCTPLTRLCPFVFWVLPYSLVLEDASDLFVYCFHDWWTYTDTSSLRVRSLHQGSLLVLYVL